MNTDTQGMRVIERVRRLAGKRETPFLAMHKQGIRDKYFQLRDAMPMAGIFYAVKCNSDKRIIRLLAEVGSGFEISSQRELAIVLACGVPPEKIITSNPLKPIPFIRGAYEAGVRHFAFDSDEEIEKLAEHAPGSRVYVRLTVSNEGSQWPLSRKFGVETERAAELLVRAASRPLIPCGITFHVGSQCTNETSWVSAIRKARKVWDIAGREGVDLTMLNLGGGFPVEYTSSIPTIHRIASVAKRALKEMFPGDIEIMVEPGRVLVGEAGTLVTTVIAKARRNGENWLYLDVGVFNGLMESIGGIEYCMRSEREGPLRKWVTAGPSCDSMDTISNSVELPELEIGDQVHILSAGAYTTAYASEFNGCPIPRVYLF